MGSFGGFYKGEKKKKRKGESSGATGSYAPVFVPPQIVSKEKKEK